jgi:hypothetical protein
VIKTNKNAGLNNDNEENEVKLKVKLLLDLKAALPTSHSLRPEEREKLLSKERDVRRSKNPYRELSEAEVAEHLTQRKIHNMFQSTEVSSEFRLLELLNPKTGFDLAACTIIATEKWDGTTMQATNKGIFKRRDLIKPGDPRKFEAEESERYTLIEIDIYHSGNKHLKNAMSSYLDVFKIIPDGICLYFEAVGPKIQGSFANAFKKGHGGLIRIFDSSRDGLFLPFGDTVEFCAKLGLPVVQHFVFSDPSVSKKNKHRF